MFTLKIFNFSSEFDFVNIKVFVVCFDLKSVEFMISLYPMVFFVKNSFPFDSSPSADILNIESFTLVFYFTA